MMAKSRITLILRHLNDVLSIVLTKILHWYYVI